jgi:chromosome segregation ATPase
MYSQRRLLPFTGFAKRTRSPSPSPTHHKLQELRHTIEQQSSELTRLKSEKAASDQTSSQLSALHSKTENENRILKRAVAIQQERQNQLLGEVEEGRRFRVEAEERIRRLEQMNLSLQYQLQQSGIGGSGGGNDFMRFRHPDVY